ncbi:MarR family transcriptional regulator [Kibdelosporangium aridum]|uniref:MarR family transcriptional regulator n=1 Tax=Kibdelosporangium aridum TaxID=2030 RepID=A0A428Z122_KIBAR|nr:MarR family transcriptional regulator [Kibdelosporangium aridum]
MNEQQRLAGGQAVRLHAVLAAKAGVNITDITVLAMLEKSGAMTPGQIAQQAGLSRGGAITAVIDRLEKGGFVRRRREDEDRRKVTIELVPDGAYQVVTASMTDFSARYLALIDQYSPEQQAILLDFAQRANDLVGDFMAELQATEK